MAIDWRDQTRADRLTFQMVSPTNVDQTYGELEGVDLSGSSLTAAYYTDTRTSGKIRVVGGNWVRGSMIRVIHEVPDWGWRRELGTYIVTNDGASRSNGAWVTELTLNSRLFGLSTDKHERAWTIAKGARALKAMEQSLGDAKCPYVEQSPKDLAFKDPKVIEAGTTRLAALFDICSSAEDRLDVDGHGRVVIAPYVEPSSKTAVWRIDLEDERGVALDGLSRETDWLQMADVVVIHHKYTKGKSEKEVVGVAKVSDSLHQSHAKRGYTVTNFQSVSDLKDHSSSVAQQKAKEQLAKDQRELIEWKLSTTYLPIWEGDVVELWVHDGEPAYQGVRKCLVKNLDLSLENMTMSLTLKETGSGDKGDEN